ncbi:DsbA family protein [Psychromonas sp.]|uniref:DsbA family protein n=1 Tax=Psychromonas sp. TaxID=1884585 RepID=UPI003566F955
MKKIFALVIGLILFPLSAQAADFKEGVHYEVIKQTATATPEVKEFFSFYCPHCFQFEPLISNLKKQLPEDVKIKKVHVNFLGKQMGPELTQAYAAAEILKVEDKLSSLIFDQIHTQKKNINGREGVIELFEKAGISKQEATGALASFPVSGLASQMKRDTETFAIRGVPTLIVNGKYKVNTGSVKSTAEFVELVTFLTQKKG